MYMSQEGSEKKREILIRKCRYYRGEDKNPYIGRNFGWAFWWDMEFESVERGQAPKKDELSEAMKYYIKEKMWSGDGQPDTTWETALERATSLYKLGEWSRGYITCQCMTLEHAVQNSQNH